MAGHDARANRRYPDITGLRVHAARPDIQGVVDQDRDGDRVHVRWDDGDTTWSRRDLLYIAGECSTE